MGLAVTGRFVESIKHKRWWDAEKVEILPDKNGQKFVHFYLTPATAKRKIRRIKGFHLLKNGKVAYRKRIGMTRVCTNDSFMIVMPLV